MKEILDNPIFQGVLGAIAFAAISLLWNYVTFKKNERNIYNLLKKSPGKFQSTAAISSHTGIEAGVVQKVALKSQLIMRNSKQKESWCLVSK